mgnify:FL=1
MSDDIRHGVTVYPHVAGWDTEPVVIPATVAAQLWSTHSDEWCIRLIDELLELMEAAKDAERHDRIAAAILAGAGALE